MGSISGELWSGAKVRQTTKRRTGRVTSDADTVRQASRWGRKALSAIDPPYTSLLILLVGFQLKVTAAQPGKVNFELDIKKEHTV